VTADATRSANTLTATFQEAGLGNEPQVHVVPSATALCINGGGNHPKAVNKTSVNAAGNFPVQGDVVQTDLPGHLLGAGPGRAQNLDGLRTSGLSVGGQHRSGLVVLERAEPAP
jgi:hypothetical protein